MTHLDHCGAHFRSAREWAERGETVSDHDDAGLDPTRAPLSLSPLGPTLCGRLRQALATPEGVEALREELAKYGLELREVERG